ARLIHQLGPARVIQVAREFGISTPIPNEASIALGTANVSLLELTAAYAGIAAGKAPVRPHGLPDPERQDNWFARAGGSDLDPRALSGMRDMLSAVVTQGTGGRAALSVDAYGKTGTTQDGRDVLFVGYANGLVVGVWVGNDDNSPNPGLRSSIPAGIWRDFMVSALGVTPPRRAPAPQPEEDAVIVNGADLLESIGNAVDIDLPDVGIDLNKGVEGPGFSVRRNGNGDIVVETGPPDLRPRQGDPVPQEGRDRPRQPGGEGN
ncbi:MAG: penicillin-binding transpeptidase domain-containing protein, partial [Pseudomonadota bacterium]